MWDLLDLLLIPFEWGDVWRDGRDRLSIPFSVVAITLLTVPAGGVLAALWSPTTGVGLIGVGLVVSLLILLFR